MNMSLLQQNPGSMAIDQRAENMRVAIFSDAIPERNGAGSYYHDLAEQLRYRVEALELIQPGSDNCANRPWLTFPLPGDSTQKLVMPNVIGIRRQFRTLKPHLVVAVTPGPFGMLGKALARGAGAGFITAFHTHFEDIAALYSNSVFLSLVSWYMKKINTFLFNSSDTVLVNNSGLQKTVEDLGAVRTDIIGTPVAHAFLKPPATAVRAGIEQILFAGRLGPEKNIPSVIQAARALPEIRFVIAGDGPLRKEVEAAGQSLANLRVTGWLSREALCEEFDNADLLILPSHLETFGTIALEAMVRGRPALVAANAGIHQWEMLKDALYTLEEGVSLSQALVNITFLPEKIRQKKAAAARELAMALNEQTIAHWASLVECYGRRSDKRAKHKQQID